MTKKKATTRKKKGLGRPSAYRPEYAEQGYKLSLLGLTDAEMADVFGVSEQTLNAWKKAQPAFLESITRGKESADANVAASLYHRAIGYEHDDVYPSSFQGEVTLTPIRKHYPPDTNAASLWLRNRQSGKWRDKQHIEHSGDSDNPVHMHIDNMRRESRHDLRRIAERERQLAEAGAEAAIVSESGPGGNCTNGRLNGCHSNGHGDVE